MAASLPEQGLLRTCCLTPIWVRAGSHQGHPLFTRGEAEAPEP